jgi:LuxR family maltose regulon positive regulatory protein
VEKLTKREEEILEYIWQGKKPREIAETLVLSVDTIKAHLKNARGKLGCTSSWEAAKLTKKGDWQD